jgi:hypothetical protein
VEQRGQSGEAQAVPRCVLRGQDTGQEREGRDHDEVSRLRRDEAVHGELGRGRQGQERDPLRAMA